ncbi:sensor histidine kinase [Bacillus sp. S13(2024)]|uniref:sensor histidine kinase n=1 Tax=unclassified Bacillus (in: firmicutes) TaxID=185979 RepID=UPI003D25BF9A
MLRLKLWNWYFIFIFFIRTIWFFSIFMNTTSLNYSDDEVPKGMVFFILLIPYLVPFYFYRPGKYQPTAYMITDFILAVGLFFFFTEAYRSWALYAVTIGYISRGTTHLWTAPALLVIFPVLAIITGNDSKEIMDGYVIAYIIFYGLGFALGKLSEKNEEMKKLLDSIHEKNKILEQYSNQIEQLTIKEERNRMARDMHDTVGHTFTTVITGMDALPFLIKSSPKEAELYVKDLVNVARSGLESVRNSIHQMSVPEEYKNVTELLQQMMTEFSKHTSTIVSFHIHGKERALSVIAKHTLLRCLQESLTNAVNHGKAKNIDIMIHCTENALELCVKDDGEGDDSLTYGFGLTSMKERVASLHGFLEVSSKRFSGTILICKIPFIKEQSVL